LIGMILNKDQQIGDEDESSEEAEMAPLELGVPNGEVDPLAARSEAVPKKRGRKKIQPRWSRVISLDDVEDRDRAAAEVPPLGERASIESAHLGAEGHEIEGDFEELARNPLQAPLRRQNNWRLLFCPKDFWERLEH
jgi:hypothetical protein